MSAFFPTTVDVNIIGAPKMRNNFWYPIKIPYCNIGHSLLLTIQLSLFQLCNIKSCRSQPLCFIFIGFVDSLITSFLYCFPYSYRSSNYRDSYCCRLFRLLKALAKSNGKFSLSPLTSIKSDNFRYRYSWKRDNLRESNQEKKQRTNTINEAKKIKSDNFNKSNREKINIAIAILE